MGSFYRGIWYRYFQITLLLFAGTALLSFFLFKDQAVAILAAQLLSLLFVSSNYFVVRNVRQLSDKIFYRRFLTGLALRFLLVITGLVIMLTVIKFHQIYFTVSFIISYILHSAIEIVSINKILQTDN
ncbi:MAG TPA: hypothetical protein VK112_01575 [Fodinibius sp.]|nr:hypothetical protein [Fodinibius sp.]